MRISWENSLQVEARLSDVKEVEELKNTHSLHAMLSAAIFSKDYVAAPDVPVHLAPSG
jgi:hypothetical protein